MLYLVAHPWDAYGAPPTPGQPYQEPAPADPSDPTWTCGYHYDDEQHSRPADCADALDAEAQEAQDEADQLREEAWDKDSKANVLRDRARAMRNPPPAPGQVGADATASAPG